MWKNNYKRIWFVVGICLLSLWMLGCKGPLPEKQVTEDSIDVTEVYVAEESFGVIAKESAFSIKLNKAVDASYVRDHLVMEPIVDYDLEKTSETEFKLIPKEPLEAGSIVSIKHQNQTRVAGWAFQVSSDFSVESIYPANRSDRVPVNSGIEIEFNEPVDTSIFEFIKIEPDVSFTGKINQNTVTLIPDSLEEDVRYEVTISNNYFNTYENALKEPFQSVFTTSGDQGIDVDIYFNMSLLRPSDPVIVPVSYYRDEKPIEVDLYKIDSAEAYLKSAESFNELMGYYKYPQNKFAFDDMELVVTGEMPVGQVAHMGFAVLPDLSDGYYLAVCKSSGDLFYDFFQISPFSIYFESSQKGTLIWGLDSRTSIPLEGAKILVDGISIGVTDSQGTVFVDANAHESSMRLQTNEADIVLPLPSKNSWFYDYYAYDYDGNNTSGWLDFLYTDRPVYQKEDTISFYGMLHHKKNDLPDHVMVKIIDGYGNNLWSGDYDVSRFGTYQGEIMGLETLTEYNRLEVFVGEERISSRNISITDYEKPEFTISTMLDSLVSGPGDRVNISGNAQFFDDTPARDLALLIQSNDQGQWYGIYEDLGEVRTDSMGKFSFDFLPQVTYETSEPKMVSIAVTNQGAEQQDVASLSNLQVFPTNTILGCELEVLEEEKIIQVKVTTHALKLPLKPVDPTDIDSYSGESIDQSIEVEVISSYYRKVEEGYKYDPILKINEMQYSHVYETETIESFNAVTQNGRFDFEFQFDPEKTYEVIIRTMDDAGIQIKAERYFYGPSYFAETNQPAPYFEDSYEIKVGDAFAIDLNFPDGLKESSEDKRSKTLFVLYNESYQMHEVSSDHIKKGVMTAEMIPNAVLKAVYFDGEKFHMGYEPPITLLQMSDTDRQLELVITTDKSSYKPGEEMVVEISATDNGIPVEAQINLNIVDEAYYALYPESVDAHDAFYEFSYQTGIQYFNYTGYYKIDSMAEMGEGGGNGYYIRKDFKDTAIFTSIETNAKGVGKAILKLPDNITTWRLTVHGIDESLNVGTKVEKRISSLPFYVRYILNDSYLLGEEPVLMLRSGGSQYKASEPTVYRVELEDSQGGLVNFEAEGNGDGFIEVMLNSLETGTYKVTIFGEHRGFKDAAQTSIEIRDSFVVFDAIRETDLSQSFKPIAPEYGYKLRFWHEGALDLQKQIHEVEGLDHRRAEWLLAGVYAQENHADKDLDLLTPFIDSTGGLKPLVNSEADIMVTLDAAVLSLDYLNPVQLKSYFNSVYRDENRYEWQRLYALWGLARLNEPILYDLERIETYEAENGVIVGNIYAELGAYDKAYEHYNAFDPKAYMDDLKPMYLFDLASLGAILGVDTAEDWYSLATAGLEKRHTWQLKQLRYLREKQEKLEPLSLVYTVNGKSFDHDLHDAWPISQIVQKSDLFNIDQVDSGIIVEEVYTGTLENSKFNEKTGYAITRSVSNRMPDLAERITVKVVVNKPAYESIKVIETIPTGFTLVEPKVFMNNRRLVFMDSGEETQVVFTYVLKPRQKGSFFMEPGILSMDNRSFLKTEQLELMVD